MFAFQSSAVNDYWALDGTGRRLECVEGLVSVCHSTGMH